MTVAAGFQGRADESRHEAVGTPKGALSITIQLVVRGTIMGVWNNFIPRVTSGHLVDIIHVNHDTMSFQQLYGRYSEDVYRFSFWLTGDADEAKDITSETFARAGNAVFLRTSKFEFLSEQKY